MSEIRFCNTEYMQLLKRPRELPNFIGADAGINAVWKCKMVYWSVKKKLIPRIVYKGTIKIQYSNLFIEGLFPSFKETIPLVSICYVEADENKNLLSVRGRWFKIEMFGISNILEVQEWFRFLIIRQRIPHSILRKKFDWEMDKEINNEQKYDKNNCYNEKKYIQDDNISIYDNLSINSLKQVPTSFKKSLISCLPFIAK
ncbi:Hypothetical protein SRAE_X000093800 [Strongyloides ratti]|uniref:Uncharacterized protein n=1 Tax=Strongyloides ratti TaxID=34506 RepID=A0A090LVC2_STRRB|nr:Hypothetical protein SRAE_X000093800 [Strongyloides ratti]CEF71614.1 Hypothetical protein SRAE_X000093800 [Strongyloides ratti]